MTPDRTAFALAPARPFEFRWTVLSHGWVTLPPNRWDEEREALERVERLASGRVVLLTVAASGDGDSGLSVGVEGAGGLTASEEGELRGTVSRMLRLGEDLSGFYRLCRQRGGEWERATEGRGRLLRSPSVFEDTVKTILTTNVQWGGTQRMAAELVEAFGEPYPPGPDRRAFPTPEAIAEADPEAFAGAVGLGYRAPYVHELARRVASGELDLEALLGSDLPTDALEEELLGIKGVGPYAAATLLTLLGRYDRLTVDSVFRRFVAERHFDGEPPTEGDARAVYEGWGEWKHLAYWFERRESVER